MRRSVRSLAMLVAAMLVGCEALHSDAENFARQERAERARRLAGMKAATQQTAHGREVSGDALAQLVSGRTHVFVYGTTPGGRAERYVEYGYFRPDGRFVYRNTQWATDADGRDGSHWRIGGERLCVLNVDMSSDEQCYRLAVQTDGRVQYFIAAPGTASDGLLTKVTDRVTEGAPAVGTDSGR
jgi:hypothetical protein